MDSSARPPVIVWFRRDLRLTDNPALNAATETNSPLILLYILEEGGDKKRPLGGASRWWLNKSLQRLAQDINKRGGSLTLRRGPSQKILEKIISETGAKEVFWNRRYNIAERSDDKTIKTALTARGLKIQSFNANLLTEPWTYQTKGGSYYKVFSPYWRKLQNTYHPPPALDKPTKLDTHKIASESLADWALHPSSPDWSTGFDASWTPGEDTARSRLSAFLSGPINQYQDHRNRPDIEHGTAGLSPHLAFGEISPAQIWRAVTHRIDAGHADPKNAMIFLSQIAWREFSYVLLFHNPDLSTENYNPSFEHMPWRQDAKSIQAWQRGQTGYPMVDAGMRQLWQTGWMHNRVRLIVASFLTKHLLLHWTSGETWFWDTLVDADPAANAASWQWTAGSGADAAPYFRVFNPITQGAKFDVTGDYVRKFCPELARLPTKFIHRPWEAPPAVLAQAHVKLGDTYPLPIVDHKIARERALAGYSELKEKKAAAADGA